MTKPKCCGQCGPRGSAGWKLEPVAPTAEAQANKRPPLTPLSESQADEMFWDWDWTPAPDDWCAQTESKRLEAAYHAGLRDGERAHGIGITAGTEGGAR